MTEPIKLDTLGGVTYNRNDVRETKTEGNMHTLIFNNGESLTYPTQPPRKVKYNLFCLNNGEKTANYRDAKPSVSANEQEEWYDLPYPRVEFDIKDIMGATFKSSKKTIAKVGLEDCQDCIVDLAANNSLLLSDTVGIRKGSNNKVILDRQDYAYIDGVKIDEHGTHTQD